jgi:transposase
MSLSGMGESMCVEGATDAAAFEVYVEHFLAPSLCEGQVVVMDNLGAHQPKRIRELIEARGAELVFLPSYSLDLNPNRASVLQDQEHLKNARCAHPQSPAGGDGRGAL